MFSTEAVSGHYEVRFYECHYQAAAATRTVGGRRSQETACGFGTMQMVEAVLLLE